MYCDFFGYDGTATVAATYNSDTHDGHASTQYRGHASTQFTYHLSGDILAALRFLIGFLILLLLLILLLFRGRLGKFNPMTKGGNPELAGKEFHAPKGSQPRGTVLHAKRLYNCRMMNSIVAHEEVPGSPSDIKLEGVFFSMGNKARFKNWDSWKNAGWQPINFKNDSVNNATITTKSIMTHPSGTSVKFSNKRK